MNISILSLKDPQNCCWPRGDWHQSADRCSFRVRRCLFLIFVFPAPGAWSGSSWSDEWSIELLVFLFLVGLFLSQSLPQSTWALPGVILQYGPWLSPAGAEPPGHPLLPEGHGAPSDGDRGIVPFSSETEESPFHMQRSAASSELWSRSGISFSGHVKMCFPFWNPLM